MKSARTIKRVKRVAIVKRVSGVKAGRCERAGGAYLTFGKWFMMQTEPNAHKYQVNSGQQRQPVPQEEDAGDRQAQQSILNDEVQSVPKSPNSNSKKLKSSCIQQFPMTSFLLNVALVASVLYLVFYLEADKSVTGPALIFFLFVLILYIIEVLHYPITSQLKERVNY